MNRNPRTSPRTNFFATGFVPVAVYGSAGELEELHEYLLTVAEFVAREAGEFEKGVETALREADLSDSDEEDFFAAHEEEFVKWHSGFPTTVLASVLLTACARFEGHLTDLAVELDRNASITKTINWTDPTKDTGVRRVARYFRSNFLIHFEDFKRWAAVLEAYRIRDAFVHAMGRVDLVSDQQALQNAIAQHAKDGVSVDELHRIIITRKFVEHLLADMRAFWRALGAALSENAIVGPVYWR